MPHVHHRNRPHPEMHEKRRLRFHDSMKVHQIEGHGTSWFSLLVVLLDSDNPHISPGARGVLRIAEQGTDLGVSQAVFHHLHDDGQLGAPVECRNPVFTYIGRGV